MEKILISIIIPCYNSARFIGELLDTLGKDDTAGCEIIAVNDGSTDDTEAEISRFHGVQLVSQPNKGVSAARNAGLREARGEYILFLDSDDTLTAGTLGFYKKAVSEAPDAQIIACGYRSESSGGVTDYSYPAFDGKTLAGDEALKLFLTKVMCFHICSFIARKDVYEHNGLSFTEGLRIGEDVEMLIKLLAAVSSVSYHSRHCFVYRIRSDSAMGGYSNYSPEQFASLKVNINAIAGITTPELEKYCNFFLANSYLSNLNYYLRSELKDEEINRGFAELRYLIRRHIPVGNIKRYLIIKCAGLVPLRLLLKIKHKI